MSDDQAEQLRSLQRQIAAMAASITRLAGDRKTVTFAEFAQPYMVEKLNNPTLRIATKRSFAIQVVNHLIPAFGAMPIDKITNSEWLKWVMATRTAGKKRGVTRFFNARKYLVEILLAAKNEGHIEKLPKLDNPDAVQNVGRALEDREVLKILRHTKDRMMRFFFYVLYKMGCRPREILSWEWTMIRWGEPGKTWIDIPARISKNDRNRSIPLNPNVSRRLFRRRENGSRFVFPDSKRANRPQLSYSNAWKRSCAAAKVKAMPYDLRRTFITRAAAEGKPLLYVAKCLDTSTKMIESVYAKAQVDVMEGIVK